MFLYRLQGTIASTKYVDRWKKKSRTRQKITVKFTHLVATLFIYPRTLVILVAIIKIISVITFTSGSFYVGNMPFVFLILCLLFCNHWMEYRHENLFQQEDRKAMIWSSVRKSSTKIFLSLIYIFQATAPFRKLM